jgi:hypothetical protein
MCFFLLVGVYFFMLPCDTYEKCMHDIKYRAEGGTAFSLPLGTPIYTYIEALYY